MALPDVASATAATLPGVQIAVLKSEFTPSSLDVKNANVVFVSRSANAIEAVMQLPGARRPATAPVKPWTDDYSDVLGAILRHFGWAAT